MSTNKTGIEPVHNPHFYRTGKNEKERLGVSVERLTADPQYEVTGIAFPARKTGYIRR